MPESMLLLPPAMANPNCHTRRYRICTPFAGEDGTSQSMPITCACKQFIASFKPCDAQHVSRQQARTLVRVLFVVPVCVCACATYEPQRTSRIRRQRGRQQSRIRRTDLRRHRNHTEPNVRPHVDLFCCAKEKKMSIEAGSSNTSRGRTENCDGGHAHVHAKCHIQSVRRLQVRQPQSPEKKNEAQNQNGPKQMMHTCCGRVSVKSKNLMHTCCGTWKLVAERVSGVKQLDAHLLRAYFWVQKTRCKLAAGRASGVQTV